MPTEQQKQRRREEIAPLWLVDERPEPRPPLHPLGVRRVSVERFYSRLARAGRTQWPGSRFGPRSACGLKAPSAP